MDNPVDARIVERSPEGYVRVVPDIDFSTLCPKCGISVQAEGWQVTGMWTMGNYDCPSCRLKFIEDLPYSLGVVMPVWLDRETGNATPRYSGQWYADITTHAWKNRKNKDVKIRVIRNPSGKSACLVNCLYPCWGDAVSLLLRINQLLNTPGMEIIVLVNPGMQWLIPDSVSGIWEVDQGLGENGHWSENIDAWVKAHAAALGLTLSIPITFECAYLTREEIQSVSNIQPFRQEQWVEKLKEKPTVTFMWRTDRAWSTRSARRKDTTPRRLLKRLEGRFPIVANTIRGRAASQQVRNINLLAGELRKVFPDIEFAVCGIDTTGAIAPWIKDLRADSFLPDTNQIWAEQSARSHIFIGVHGSHTSLFSSLAGASVELTPNDRLANIMQCSPITSREPRDAIYTHRFLPVNTDPLYLTDVVLSIMFNYSYFRAVYSDDRFEPLKIDDLAVLREKLMVRHEVTQHMYNRRNDLAN